MALDFLKRLLSQQPGNDQFGQYENENNGQYENSPLDPLKNQTSLLSSMISPESIQKPLYDYTNTPEENMNDGAPLALQVPQTQQNIPSEPMQMPDISSAIKTPIAKRTPSAKPESVPSELPQQPISQPISTEMKQEEKQDDFMSQLLNMQKQKTDDSKLLAMIEAGDRIGTAIAGQGNLQYEKGKFDFLKPLVGKDVDDLLQREDVSQKRSKFKQDTEKGSLDIEKAKMQMSDEKAKLDPNSEVSKLARASVIDSLSRIGRSDLAKTVSPNMSIKQIEDIFGQYNLNNMVSAYDAQQNRLEVAKTRSAEKAIANKDKMDQADIGRLDKANKMITASIASSRGAFGKTANILRSAEAIETLVSQQPLGQMDNRQIQELARSLDAMLSQGAATITGTAHLVPRSMSGDVSKIQEYISNIPRGAGQAGFVKKMVETVQREKELAKKQISRESRKMLSSYADLAKKQPEAWKLMLQQHDLPEDVFNLEDNKEISHPQFNVDQNALDAEMKRRGL